MHNEIMIIVGEESCGLSTRILDYCHDNGYIVQIPAMGSVRSLNVATAFGIAAGLYREVR
jgi:tRNA G18 (ribose-2'-O)-methylase SpoU